jgi:hypothetical protein
MSSVSEKVVGNRDVKMARCVVEIVVDGVVVVFVVVDFGTIGVVEGARFMKFAKLRCRKKTNQ